MGTRALVSYSRDQIKAQCHPGEKGNCGFFMSGWSSDLQTRPIRLSNVLNPNQGPVDQLRHRYFSCEGGGDGGGTIVRVALSSLANLYQVRPDFFTDRTRILQVNLSQDPKEHEQQLSLLIEQLDALDISICHSQEMETDYRSLREHDRKRQGTLHHLLLQFSEEDDPLSMQHELRRLTHAFNFNQQRLDIEQEIDSPADIQGVFRDQLILKSFQGDHLTDIFPFLKDLDIRQVAIHLREATNTGPRRASIHPMSNGSFHNGEINNIEKLRVWMRNNPSFRDDFLGFQGSKSTLQAILKGNSDTYLKGVYDDFCRNQQRSTDEVALSQFMPIQYPSHEGFIVQGPAAFVSQTSSGNILVAGDDQVGRPVHLELLECQGNYHAFRVGSLPGMTVSSEFDSLGTWRKVDMKPGRVVKITPQLSSTEVTHFKIDFLTDAIEPEPRHFLTTSKGTSHSIVFSDSDLAMSRQLHYRHPSMVAMGDHSLPNPSSVFRLATAAVTNTAYSLNINRSDMAQRLTGEGPAVYLSHPVLGHEEYAMIVDQAGTVVIDASLGAMDAFQADDALIHSELQRIESEVRSAVEASATTIIIQRVAEDRVPLSPKEAVLYRVFETLCGLGRDGISDAQSRINVVDVGPSQNGAQDAYLSLAAGAHFVYHPHAIDDEIKEYREGLQLLMNRVGISRANQLVGSLLFYTQNAAELARLAGVDNIGGDRFSDVAEPTRVTAQHCFSVNRDFGQIKGSPAAKMNQEIASLMKSDYSSASRQMYEWGKRHGSIFEHVSFTPTVHSNVPPILAILGFGGAGVTALESIPENRYRVIVLEKVGFNRMGNTRFISGHHQATYLSVLHRANAVLNRSDVTYLGGVGLERRSSVMDDADHVIDCTGASAPTVGSEHYTAQDFLNFCYGSGQLPSRDHAGILVSGNGKVAVDMLKALLLMDPRTHESTSFQNWLSEFPRTPMIIQARRGLAHSGFSKADFEAIISTCEAKGLSFRILGPLPETITDPELAETCELLAPYQAELSDQLLPLDGVTFCYHTQVNELDNGLLSLDVSGQLVSVPGVGVSVQGYVPSLASEISVAGSSVKQGWAKGQGGDLSDIMKSVLDTDPISDQIYASRSLDERLAAHERIDRVVRQPVPVDKQAQLRLLAQLILDPYTPGRELAKLVQSGPVVLNSEPSTETDPPTDESVSLFTISESELIPNELLVLDGDRSHSFSKSDDQSVFHLLAKQLDVDTACGGDGTCGECTADIMPKSLFLPATPAERAIAGSMMPQAAHPRLTCQLPVKAGTGYCFAPNTPISDALKKRTLYTAVDTFGAQA
ncbi:MAG: hypothetical protein CL521_04060 [Actinobacteria bacterium]|nr:hypothetical protein [Actinomycetota bacterium]